MMSALLNFKAAFLVFQGNRHVRKMTQGICVGLISAGLLFEISFYPNSIVLLFSLGLGGLALSCPRLSLILCMFLSLPSMAYNDTGVWMIYLILCLPLVGATKNHWFLGLLTFASIEIWLANGVLAVPAIGILSAIPIILAGIILSPSSGATAGAISAIFATFFTVYTISPPNPIPIPDFHPYTIVDVFLRTDPQRALQIATQWVNVFQNKISVWVEVILFVLTGYLAGKSTSWWRHPRITSRIYPTMLAAISSSLFFLTGVAFMKELGPFILPSISLEDMLDLVAMLVAIPLFGSFLFGTVRLEENLARVRSIVSAIELRLGDLSSRINEAREKGVRISEYKTGIKRLDAQQDNIQKLCSAWKFTEAIRMANKTRREAENNASRLADEVGRLDSYKETLKNVEAKIRIIRRTISRIAVKYPSIDVSPYKDDLEALSLDVQSMDRENLGIGDNLTKLESEARRLSKKCDTLIDELEETRLVCEEWPIWQSRVKMLLDSKGKATREDLFGAPRDLRKYVLARYWAEVEDEVRGHLMFWGDDILIRTTRHLDLTRTEFEKDVIGRKDKIQKFETKYGIKIRPADSFEALIGKLGLAR
jgi:predicted  nucleic acid-binding Zn-ribbon protein